MGFLGKLFGKKENDTIENTVTQQITTEKDLQNQNDEESNSPMMPIDMSKHQENLNTVLINMSKDNKIDMTKHVARVALAMDYSGSMSNLFRNGSVQETVSRLLPIALRFDDNGELESWLFSNGSERLAAVTKDNYSTYVRKVMNKANMSMGGTNYAPVLKEMVSYYKDIEPSEVPAFIIYSIELFFIEPIFILTKNLCIQLLISHFVHIFYCCKTSIVMFSAFHMI